MIGILDDIPKYFLHGTPANVIRISDGLKYRVKGVYFDGDRHGFAVTIWGRSTVLVPGEYLTHSIYLWHEEKNDLEIKILD